MRKKIGVYLQSTPTCGGTYQYNQLIVDALIDLKQFQICAVFRDQHWHTYLKNKPICARSIAKNRVWDILIGLWRRLKLPVSLWRATLGKFHPLTRALKKENCDFWIFPSQDPFYWYPVPAVGVVHDLMHRYERQFEEVGGEQEYQRREFHYKLSSRYGLAIFVDSQLGKEQLEYSYNEAIGKGKVLPFIAAKDIAYRKAKNDFNEKYPLPSKYLFYPAQFWKHKNHENLLKAIQLVKKTYPDINLVLVGSPKNAYSEVLKAISELKLENAVHVFGYVEEENLPEFYKRARALVMPTFCGPTNIPPLEAFALRCPVVISRVYAMPSQLRDCALYFDPASVEDIAHKIQLIWGDDHLYQALVEKGVRHHQGWGFEAFKKHFAAILDNV